MPGRGRARGSRGEPSPGQRSPVAHMRGHVAQSSHRGSTGQERKTSLERINSFGRGLGHSLGFGGGGGGGGGAPGRYVKGRYAAEMASMGSAGLGGGSGYGPSPPLSPRSPRSPPTRRDSRSGRAAMMREPDSPARAPPYRHLAK